MIDQYPIKPVFFYGNHVVIEVISGYAVCESSRIGDYDPRQDELYFFGHTFRGENTVKKRLNGAIKDAVKKAYELHRIDIRTQNRMLVNGYEVYKID